MTRRALAHVLAQGRVPLLLALASGGRVARRAVRVEETTVGGVPATVYRPVRGGRPRPCVIVLPGVTRRGRAHPGFRAIGRGLAATGHLVVVAEPDGLAAGELTPATLQQARAAVEAAMSRRDAAGSRVALVGVSGGATLALLVAAEPAFADRVTAVGVLAPCCDIAEGLRFATTGVYRDGDVLVPFETGPFFKLVLARSIVGWLPPEDGRALRSHLVALDDYGPDPLAGVRDWPRDELGTEARSVVELLANEDPERFDPLVAALPARLGASLRELSPVTTASGIKAPVELVVPRADKYVPFADATTFAEACPTARLTVLESLAHAVPRVSPAATRDLARLDGVLVRLLAAARAPASYSRL